MRSFVLVLSALSLVACGEEAPPPVAMGPCGTITEAFRFADGSKTGHADPAGARAAGQARAGVITKSSQIRLPADTRFPVRIGDYLLANEKIALYIGDARTSDGYSPFGGEILAIDTIGADGLPRGLSEWSEAVFAAGGMGVHAEQVSVIADGSDGGPAIVRSQGMLALAPFLQGYTVLFGDAEPVPAAIDYVLAPGAEKVTLRLSLQNTRTTASDLSGGQLVAFLMNRAQSFAPEQGFATLESDTPWVGWEAGDHAVGARGAPGLPLRYLAAVEGAQIFRSSGATMEACQAVSFDFLELVAAYPGIDALGEAMRRGKGEPSWRTITGVVRDAVGSPQAGALVHVTRPGGGAYLTRARTGSDGRYTLHAPPEAVELWVSAEGLPLAGPTLVDATEGEHALTVGKLGRLSITTKELGSGLALPARIQVYPIAPPAEIPERFGAADAGQGRARLVFAVDGKAELDLAEGSYRVVVSHGYEYELFERTVSVASNGPVVLAPTLERSVATPGVLSGDFHIHSDCSLDSADPVVDKVRGALAEGLELPTSSEHEYIVDFGPVVEQLGATRWARGFASEELSTSTYGHFGVVPLAPRPELPNRGTVQWAGLRPPAIFDEVRKLPGDPVLIVNHPMAKSGYKGYFADVDFDETSATGDALDWSTNFDVIEVCNDSDFASNREDSAAAWFSLIRHGKRVFMTGASDNHKMSSAPVGYPRNYLALGTDDPQTVTPVMLRDAIRAGHSVVGGGLYMTVRGPGEVAPGGTVAGPGPHSFEIVVLSPSWVQADTLEVIVDGVTKETRLLQPSVAAGPGRRYEATVDVVVEAGPGPHFVAFHAASPTRDLAPVHPGKKPFVVSNPIFFE